MFLTGFAWLVAVPVLLVRMSVPDQAHRYAVTAENVREQLVQNKYTKTSILLQYPRLLLDLLPFCLKVYNLQVMCV